MSYTIKLTLLKCTIHWFVAYSQSFQPSPLSRTPLKEEEELEVELIFKGQWFNQHASVMKAPQNPQKMWLESVWVGEHVKVLGEW